MRKIAFLVTCFVVLGLVACGGGSSTPTPTPTPIPTPTPTPTPAVLTVTPATAQVALGAIQQFSATGTGTPVNWSVNGVSGGNATVGTITPTGLYQAPLSFPNPNNFSVTATSQADNTKIANSALSVVYPNQNKNTQPLPISLGSSGGNVNDTSATGCCIGTLGSLINRGGVFYILSNNHVLDRSGKGVAGEQIAQPGPSACFAASNIVANLTQGAPLQAGTPPGNVDAAIAQITSAAAVNTNGQILELGAASSTTIDPAQPSATLAIPSQVLSNSEGVAKSGRTSGLTCSSLISVSTSVSVDYETACGSGVTAFTATFTGQVIVGGGTFSVPGDSGSLIVTSDTAQPVALLYAGNSSGTAGNPIQDVINAFTIAGPPAVVPAIVGGANHAVSCVPTAQAPGAQPGPGALSTQAPISAQQRQLVKAAMDRHAAGLTSDPAVAAVRVGVSADNPGEGAMVIELSAAPKAPIPATMDGVRTRVVYLAQSGVKPAITTQDIERTAAVKSGFERSLMAQPGIQGVGVGHSDDDPAEPAIVIFTVAGAAHEPIPAVMGGVRTKIVEGDRFKAY